MEIKESINIPIGTTFDNKGIVSAEQAFGKFGNVINSTLKRLGSDKSLSDLGNSVKTAFDAGVKGSTTLRSRMAQTQKQALKTVQEIERLTTALEKQKKVTDETFDRMTNVHDENTRVTMRGMLSPQQRNLVSSYDISKAETERLSRRYEMFKAENQAALEGVDLQKKFLAYYNMEAKILREINDYEAGRKKLTEAHFAQSAEFFKKNGLKNYKDMMSKHLYYDTNGDKTQLAQNYDSLMEKQRAEVRDYEAKIPKTRKELEALREEFQNFIQKYITELNNFDSHFATRGPVEQVKMLQKWLSKLSYSRLEAGADGVRRLTSETVAKERELNSQLQAQTQETSDLKSEVEAIYADHAEATREVQEQNDKEEQINEELRVRIDLLETAVREMMNYANAAEDAMDTGSDIPEGDYKDALGKVFSWQRVYTLIGKLVTNIGNEMTNLGKKASELLVNIGKLGFAMMKTFGSGAVKGVTAIGSGLLNIRKRFQDMLPSVKQVARFLVKYIFGFRTMYFLVRKVRQAIGDGFKSMARVDEKVNKSISSLQMALNQLKGQVGASFAPLLNAVAPVLVNIINLATKATVQIGAFLATLMGQHTFKVAIAENVDYADSLDKTAGAAGKAAKALKAYLSPLDELNRMDDPDSGSGGGGSGAGVGDDLAVRYKDIDVNTLGISKFAQELKKAWLDQDWEGVGTVISDKLEDVFDTISRLLSWKNVEQKIGKVTDIASGIINGISGNDEMWKSLGSAIGNGLNTAIKSVNSFVGKVHWDSIGSGIAMAIGKSIKKIDSKDISKFIEDKFTVVLDLFNGFMDKMKEDDSWTEIAKKVVQSLNGVDWYTIAVKTFTFAGSIFNAIKSVMSGYITQGGFNKLITDITNGINDSINKLTPEDFKKAGETFSSTLIVALQNIGKFMQGSSESGKKILEGIKTFFLSIDWETALTEGGDIASALANGLIDIFATIGEILNTQDENGESLGEKIGAKIGEALGKINFAKLGRGFGDFAEGILEGVIAAFESIDVAEQISELIGGFVSSRSPLVQKLMQGAFWLQFAGAIVSGIGSAIPLVLSANKATGGKLASMIGSWLTGGSGAGAGAGAGAAGGASAGAGAGAVAGVGAGVGAFSVFGAVAAAAGMAAIAIQDVIDKQDAWAWGMEEIGKADSPPMKALETIWGGIKSIPEAMGDLVESSVSGWTWFFENLGKAEKETGQFTDCTTSATGAWEGFSKQMSDSGVTISGVIESIKKNWSSGVQNIKEKLGTIPGKAREAWNGIKTVFSPVAEWFEEKFKTAWEKVKEVFSTGGQIFSGIKEGIEATFKTVVNKIIDGMNKIIKKPFDKLNEMITTLKKIDVMGVKPFSNFRTISVPQIPKLAQGAVIPASKPFVAMLGDQKNGNNLEAPESLIRKIVREESGGGGGTTRVVAQVGRKVLFELVLEEAKIRQQTTGNNPFELA